MLDENITKENIDQDLKRLNSKQLGELKATLRQLQDSGEFGSYEWELLQNAVALVSSLQSRLA